MSAHIPWAYRHSFGKIFLTVFLTVSQATPEEGYRQLSDLIEHKKREAKARAVRAVLCALVEGIITRQLPRTNNL
jgi:hypothetical protein